MAYIFASDQLLMLSAIGVALAAKPEFKSYIATSEAEALRILEQQNAANLIVTPSLKSGCSLSLAKQVKAYADVKIALVISNRSELHYTEVYSDYCSSIIAEWDLDHSENPLSRAFESRADQAMAYLSPSIREYRQKAAQGTSTLTARERLVFKLILDGLSNKQIASELIISYATAKSYSRDVLRKLGAKNRSEALLQGIKMGLVGVNQ